MTGRYSIPIHLCVILYAVHGTVSSLKDLGKKLTAFFEMEIMKADEFIAYLES